MTRDIYDLHRQIELLIERERYREASRLLSQAFELQPDHPESYLLAGQIALATRDFDSADENLRHVLANDPEHFHARVLMFRLQSETEQYVEAERTITGLLRQNPEFAHLYGLYGRLMLLTMHIDRAGALAREGLRLDPYDDECRIIGLLVDVIEKRNADAAARLEEMVRDDPEALHVAWMVVIVLQSHHRHREALQVMQQILKVSPGDPDVIDSLICLRVASHWTMWPLTPLQRFGWGGSAALWGIAVFSFFLAARFAPFLSFPLAMFYLSYVIYSWVWPPVLRRWLTARGF